jgi:dTDP-4-amino-4,6-dideoxygalactose transaminase
MGAIGLVQLDVLNEAVQRRRKIAENYNQSFIDLSHLLSIPNSRYPTDTNYQLYTIRLNIEALRIDRDTFITLMMKRGVCTRLYYPCLHRQKVFSEIENPRDSEYPGAVEYSDTAVSLPIYPTLRDDEQSLVIDAVHDILIKHIK